MWSKATWFQYPILSQVYFESKLNPTFDVMNLWYSSFKAPKKETVNSLLPQVRIRRRRWRQWVSWELIDLGNTIVLQKIVYHRRNCEKECVKESWETDWHDTVHTGTQIKLLASEMIPKELCPDFGSHMSSDHGRRHFSPIANLGSNNFFQNVSFINEN